MKKWIKIIILTFLISSLLLTAGQSCTTFCLDHGDQPVFGRNLDWLVGDGLVIINKRGVKKTANAGPFDDNILTWTSKYGSATFNQHGREFPLGGMNEAGLVLETMVLEDTEYPSPDSRPEVESLQWVQYQLDNFSTIEEVIAGQSRIRIRQSARPGLHFLACDRTANCATIEFVEGKAVTHTKEMMPVKVLTNSKYAETISFWQKNNAPQHDRYKTVERFTHAAGMVKNYDSKTNRSPIDYAFDILESVAHESYTQWRIVYDVKNLSVYFQTLASRNVRHFNLKSFDFSCATPVKVVDVDAELYGDITDKFIDYSYQINRNLIGEAFSKTPGLSYVSEHVLDMRAEYPAGTLCIK